MNLIKENLILPPAGSRILVGLSGGADSVALLHVLSVMLHYETAACHLNHQFRGEESMRDERFSEEFCKELQIPFFLKRADVSSYAFQMKLSDEEAGRRIRYAFFEEIRAEWKGDYIATAHTLSDNQETFFINLIRGTSLKGLCGIPAERDRIIRPLIQIDRAGIEGYCKEHALSFVVDSTNLENRYLRNRIRHFLIPFFKKENPSFEEGMRRLQSTLTEEENFLAELAAEAKKACLVKGKYSRELLLKQKRPIQKRILASFLAENKIPITANRIEQIEKLLESPSGILSVPNQKQVVLQKSLLFVREESAVVPWFSEELSLEKQVCIPAGCFRAERIPIESFSECKKIYKNLLYIAIDYDTIKGKLSVRQRVPGDRITLAGRNGTKSVKKLFIEAGLSASEKSVCPVFADEEGIFAIGNFGTAKRCVLTPGSKRALLILREHENVMISMSPTGQIKSAKEGQ